jgi:predicted ferric reductase
MPPRKLNGFMQALQNARKNNAEEFSYTNKNGEKKKYVKVKNSNSSLVLYKEDKEEKPKTKKEEKSKKSKTKKSKK